MCDPRRTGGEVRVRFGMFYSTRGENTIKECKCCQDVGYIHFSVLFEMMCCLRNIFILNVLLPNLQIAL